jgi:hypothetical protein
MSRKSASYIVLWFLHPKLPGGFGKTTIGTYYSQENAHIADKAVKAVIDATGIVGNTIIDYDSDTAHAKAQNAALRTLTERRKEHAAGQTSNTG